MKPNRIRLGLGMLLLGAAMLSACDKEPVAQKEPPPRLVNAMRVAEHKDLGERSFPGRARAGQEVNLSFRVSGPLVALSAEVGAEFNKDDVVATMDPRDFESALRTVQGQLEREQAAVRRAQADFTRLQNVMKEDPGATSQTAVDRARQERDSARATLRSLQGSLQTAKDRLSYTKLRAPFDGVVVETYVENFETVVAKQPIVRLLDPSSIEFVVNVPENLIGLAPYVVGIDVTFDALPGVTVPATIKEIGKEASQATRTYPVTFVMAQPEKGEILPGMAGQATVRSRPPEDSDQALGTEIPATAVFTSDDRSKSFVWVIDEANKTLSRREVEVAGLSRFGTRVRTGIKAGEWIVTKGVHSVREGQQVRILDAPGKDAAS